MAARITKAKTVDVWQHVNGRFLGTRETLKADKLPAFTIYTFIGGRNKRFINYSFNQHLAHLIELLQQGAFILHTFEDYPIKLKGQLSSTSIFRSERTEQDIGQARLEQEKIGIFV